MAHIYRMLLTTHYLRKKLPAYTDHVRRKERQRMK